MLLKIICFLFAICSHSFIFAGEEEKLQELFAQGIEAHLRDPEYSDGILKTDSGGVVTAPGIRIQASKFIYQKKIVEGKPIHLIQAEGNLLLEYGEYVFVGMRLEYDFESQTGILYNGCTGNEPWYFGGEVVYLNADGSCTIENGFVTTSQDMRNDWEIGAEWAHYSSDRLLVARNVTFRTVGVPILRLPFFRININALLDSPVRYYLRFGGRLGTRIGMIYEIFSWKRLAAYLRLDYRVNRGIGVGIETYYQSVDRRQSLEMINYLARDSSIVHPHERIRYRFQGIYDHLLNDDRTVINMTWDKLSDKDMATDYNDRGLELDTAGRTQLHIRHQERAWISNFFTRVRINPFQTVKQELPTLETRWRPVELGATGIMSDSFAESSYLDFRYSNGQIDVHNYRSSRFALNQSFYKSFRSKYFTLTPQAGLMSIFYGNSPQDKSRWLAQGQFGFNINTKLLRFQDSDKHVLIPYLNYAYYTYPTSSPNQHYIFDIEDGWYRLNTMRIGCQKSIYRKLDCGMTSRVFYGDFYAQAFFHTKTIHAVIPKLYATITFSASPTLRCGIDTAWDIQRNKLDHLNLRTEWTINTHMAIAAEYRHRDAYDWRRVDRSNFILDSYHSVKSLLHSQLSDRRDTLLLHFYYRVNPRWAVEFISRQGWNRKFEPTYNEYEVDFITKVGSAWNLMVYFRHREEDPYRFAINLSVGLSRPNSSDCNTIIPALEF